MSGPLSTTIIADTRSDGPCWGLGSSCKSRNTNRKPRGASLVGFGASGGSEETACLNEICGILREDVEPVKRMVTAVARTVKHMATAVAKTVEIDGGRRDVGVT